MNSASTCTLYVAYNQAYIDLQVQNETKQVTHDLNISHCTTHMGALAAAAFCLTAAMPCSDRGRGVATVLGPRATPRACHQYPKQHSMQYIVMHMYMYFTRTCTLHTHKYTHTMYMYTSHQHT